MKLTFIGNPHDAGDNRGFVEINGVRFPLNLPVEVDGPVFARLARNSHFRVETEEGGEPEADPPVQVVPPVDYDPLDGMDRDALLAFAAERDIPVDRRLKDPAKIVAVIRQSLEE